MADEPPTTRTRHSLKSCLKLTPPITPDLSAAPSPCNSGRTSPSIASDSESSVSSGCRKTVSFCSDDELEEVFWADEWDRTPAAATPKLSYQDILELKQLRINLPCSPSPLPPRQPFTTSPPSSSKPPFPLSRFASTASHTPSKWKNRSEPQRADIDPAILPYLDAVPIRLLPLLPQSPTESEPPALPEPHPQTPTPTASPETRPIAKPPSEPPELRIEPAIPAVVSPPSSVPARKPNFAFLPLLPLQDPPPIQSDAVVQPRAPAMPRRKINMTFLPVNAMPDADSSSSTLDVSVNARTDVHSGVGTSASAVLPSPSSSVTGTDPSPDAGHLIAASESELSSSTTMTSTSDASSAMPPLPHLLALPVDFALPLNVESDTDTETDNYTDTDAESDAPSTSTLASSLPSPPCDYDSDSGLHDLKSDAELVPPGYYPRKHRDSDPGSYFPPVVSVPLGEATAAPPHLPDHLIVADVSSAHSSGPGQTPPLSVLFPSPRSQAAPLLPLDVLSTSASQSSSDDSEIPAVPASVELDAAPPPPVLTSLSLPPSLVGALAGDASLPATPLSMHRMLHKKLTLEALPSPALVPPSPFELEPHSLGGSPKVPTANDVGTAELSPAAVNGRDATPVLRAIAVNNTPDDSPLLTLENVRASWDAGARAKLAAGAGVQGIAPSLSRRRFS
ncbi:hypothetical protein C8Q76DRAFT_793185 [Earliella scabrosa]|nr:hypothetical protein C8Q76DRAFT_793185 [Earliella scabrosa]